MRTFRRKAIFFTIILVVFSVSCTEEQRQDIDKAAVKAQQIVEAGKAVLDTPAGQAIPGEIRSGLVLVGGLAAAAAGAWQTWRKQQVSKTTKAIVKAIEKTEKAQNPTGQSPLKAAIAQEMRSAGISDRGDRIVNKLKVS